jgi:hypothetical protein
MEDSEHSITIGDSETIEAAGQRVATQLRVSVDPIYTHLPIYPSIYIYQCICR